jgi:hypothetical protein
MESTAKMERILTGFRRPRGGLEVSHVLPISIVRQMEVILCKIFREFRSGRETQPECRWAALTEVPDQGSRSPTPSR